MFKYLVDTKYLKIDIMWTWNIISLGGSLGTNKFVKRKSVNIFIELYILFLTIGIEIKRR